MSFYFLPYIPIKEYIRIKLNFPYVPFSTISSNRVFFTETVGNSIFNEMSHEKFQSDKNNRFIMILIDRQFLVVFEFYDSTNKKSIIFIRVKFFITHFIRDKIFHTSTKKNLILFFSDDCQIFTDSSIETIFFTVKSVNCH